ncbi:hypothetical protein Bpfe_025792 [Biomphalaria pfeifferi]|uniref:Uncharacterized protein n=1 Tax=Biomphalaria pfeifferi TaxID=112525 RepID=A0AAD8EY35_BIOPF|nr:hypothetical protein Bpfe_025792 [Biomphalaria pfeifferi]
MTVLAKNPFIFLSPISHHSVHLAGQAHFLVDMFQPSIALPLPVRITHPLICPRGSFNRSESHYVKNWVTSTTACMSWSRATGIALWITSFLSCSPKPTPVFMLAIAVFMTTCLKSI